MSEGRSLNWVTDQRQILPAKARFDAKKATQNANSNKPPLM